MTPKTFDPEILPVTLRKLNLQTGDLLHVAVGIEDLGDGQGPWIPNSDHIAAAKADWEAVVPEGVKVIVTHLGQVPEIIRA